MFNENCITNLLLNLLVKSFENLVNI